MSKPISPETFDDALCPIPEKVFTVVNELLLSKKNPNSKNLSITINLEEVISGLLDGETTRQDVIKKKMLDFEEHYRQAGWTVRYDQPAYYESYTPFWVFSKKETR